MAEDTQAARLTDLRYVLAQLRHAYMQCLNGYVGDYQTFAKGLLAPQIMRLELLEATLTSDVGEVEAPAPHHLPAGAMLPDYVCSNVSHVVNGRSWVQCVDCYREGLDSARALIAELSTTEAPAPRPIVHVYISTACQHELHDRCRQRCKFCAVACRCACHGKLEEAAPRPIAPLPNNDGSYLWKRCYGCGHRLRFASDGCPQCGIHFDGRTDPTRWPEQCVCPRCVDARKS